MSAGRRKNPVKTSTIVKIFAGIAVLTVVIFVGIRLLRKKVDNQFGSTSESGVESTQVTTGSISTTVVGDGTLSYEESEDITLPAAVEIQKYYVQAGDSVAEGDLLASVNMTSLVSAMSDIQDEIDDIDAELEETADETIDDTIDATVSGRIKKIYAASGDDVASVMYQNNALMLISLDGKMALDVATDALAAEDSVQVLADGTTYEGTVEKVIDGTATIVLTDKGPRFGAEAEVTKEDKEIGSGTLYIHRSLSVTGYAGTVSKIKVSEGDSVEAGDTLMTLTDTSYTANYDSLLSERKDLEDQLEELVAVYKEGAVYAKEAGILVSLTKGTASDSSASSGSSSSGNTAGSSAFSSSSLSSMASMGQYSSASSSTDGTDTVFSISPADTMNITVSVDESDILSLAEGQTAQVTINSLGDDVYEGTVIEVGTTGSSSNGVTAYSAVISIPKTENMLEGMSASATIVIEGVDNALLIPVDALHKTSSSAYVYTSYDEETDTLGDMVEVTIGISNSSYVEITGGLSEGDTVYYEASSDSSDFDFSDMGDFSNMPSGDFSMPGGSYGGSFGGGSMPGGSMPGNK